MLAGAMDEIVVGDPAALSTDIGPVIDNDARAILEAHAARMDKEAKLIKQLVLDPARTGHGSFFAARAYELSSLKQLEREVFGPVLHVIRYAAKDLDVVLGEINATGYGLTLGIHSRIDATIEKISRTLRVGNCYVNRNQIGAVVGGMMVRAGLLPLPASVTNITEMVPYGTQILVSTIGAVIVVIIARFLGGR